MGKLELPEIPSRPEDMWPSEGVELSNCPSPSITQKTEVGVVCVSVPSWLQFNGWLWFQVGSTEMTDSPINSHGLYPSSCQPLHRGLFLDPTETGYKTWEQLSKLHPTPGTAEKRTQNTFFHYQWIVPFPSSLVSLIVENSIETHLMRYESLSSLSVFQKYKLCPWMFMARVFSFSVGSSLKEQKILIT